MRMKANLTISIFIAASLVVCLAIALSHRLPSKAKALSPLIEELGSIHTESGVYPVDLASLSSVAELRKNYKLYFGERTETNLVWDASDVSGHDLTILSDTNFFIMFAPVGRIKPISFSSFPVWRYTSDKPEWDRGRIHWSMLGTYWSKN